MKFIEKSDILRLISDQVMSTEFIKMTLGSYHGLEPELKNIYVKPVIIKRKFKLSFTYRYQRKDVVKNYEPEEALSHILRYVEHDDFQSLSIFHTAENIFFQQQKKRGWSWRKERITTETSIRSLEHDKLKERKLTDTGKTYLQELRLTDTQGIVFKNAQDKWKQINHYIEILSSFLKEIPKKETLKVVDMGAGKGYLTFALYDYLTNIVKQKTQIIGVEYREDLVQLCNTVAQNSNFDKLSFVQGSIEDYKSDQQTDILIALHACDTATDDAIWQGIQNQSELIVVAPCCHKQIRRELEKSKTANDLDFINKYGIFLERQAEMLTDSIRALVLEYYGYQTKVVEFVSTNHTPKNVLIIGLKKEISPAKQAEIKEKLASIYPYFGIDKHYLTEITGLS